MRIRTVLLASALLTLSGFASASSGEPSQTGHAQQMKKDMAAHVDTASEAEADPLRCSPDGLGVGGFDLISYRDADGPVKGLREFSHSVGELTYLFASAENQAKFAKDPQPYLPAYSGWCAISLALGGLTCPDYENFQVEDGQLFLFETTGFTNGRVLWNSDAEGYRGKADENFLRLISGQ